MHRRILEPKQGETRILRRTGETLFLEAEFPHVCFGLMKGRAQTTEIVGINRFCIRAGGRFWLALQHRTGAAGRLLGDMRQFMREQPLAGWRMRRVLTWTKRHMV